MITILTKNNHYDFCHNRAAQPELQMNFTNQNTQQQIRKWKVSLLIGQIQYKSIFMSHSEYEYLTKDEKQKKEDLRIRRRRKRRKKQKKKEGEAGRRSLCQLMWKKNMRKKRRLECEIRNKICACELPRVMTLALQQPSAFERSLCYCEVSPGLQQPYTF